MEEVAQTEENVEEPEVVQEDISAENDLESKFENRFNDMERRIEDANRRANYYQELAESKKPEEQLDPDEFVTGKDVNRIVETRVEDLTNNQKQQMLAQQQMTIREKFPDYDEVVNKHFSALLREDPNLANAVKYSSNPPLTAYKLGTTHPSYKQSEKQKTAEDVTNTIQKNLSKTKTLSNTGDAPIDSGVDYSTMSDEDFIKLGFNVKRGKRS